MDRPPLYGLDIETDTTVDGLDPQVSAIVAVALATAAGTEVFAGDEAGILAQLERHLADLPPGVIVTWNGANFDLPFLADRAHHAGVALGLVLRPRPLAPVSHPLPGHDTAYLARWGRHRHLDGFVVFRADVGVSLPVSCGLKSIARFSGLVPVEVDRTAIERLTPDELHDYVASDAELTRELIGRRWASCAAAVDVIDVVDVVDLADPVDAQPAPELGATAPPR